MFLGGAGGRFPAWCEFPGERPATPPVMAYNIAAAIGILAFKPGETVVG